MTPLLGMPIWGRAEGQSSINVYRIDDGTLVHNFHATVPVDVATTIYTFREDEPEMRAKARNFARASPWASRARTLVLSASSGRGATR